jgi:hypothetical protein
VAAGAPSRLVCSSATRSQLSRSHSPRLGDSDSIEVVCGVDVARETHHAVAVDRSGQRLADRALPNDEAALHDLFTEGTVASSDRA